ncbi:hypothetical protein JCM3766R1_001852 [Sporobolomyces carnicolor]
MSSPSPPYEAIPQEKPRPEFPVDEPTSPLTRPHEPTTMRTVAKAVIGTMLIIVAFAACVGSGAWIARGLDEMISSRCGGARVETVTESVTVMGEWKWWNKRSASDGGEDQFSTSTLRDGSTQTFVFTTRPIVNPGGYTIGTLTGYVPVSSTVSDAGPTSTVESSRTTTSTSPSRSASTIPPASYHSVSTTSQPTSRSSSSSEAWSRVSTTSLPPASTHASEASSPASLAKRSQSGEEFDFSEVDFHLLHRRGLDFESETDRQDEPVEQEAPSSTITSIPAIPTTKDAGKEEFSTSTDRQGSVYTLVKTTRPIVNPGGYTIGTLDGGWVDVNKIKPTPTAAAKRSSHEELKKREVVNL